MDFRGESKVVRPAVVAGGVVPPAGVVEREIVFAVERASRGDGGALRVARELRRNEVRGERGGRVPRTRCRLPGIVESELEAPPRNSKLLPKRRALRSSPCVHTRWRAPRSPTRVAIVAFPLQPITRSPQGAHRRRIRGIRDRGRPVGRAPIGNGCDGAGARRRATARVRASAGTRIGTHLAVR